MQASVHTYEPQSGMGSVILDTGKVLAWTQDALHASGLRHLRVGQRVQITVNVADTEDPQATVVRVWVSGISA
ncbi:hypothetical protein K0651_01155 [Ornithinimicrobium sp. Arc0846-15]|nr:hypothetical protein [Ornithinimicrobium laminariae]